MDQAVLKVGALRLQLPEVEHNLDMVESIAAINAPNDLPLSVTG